MTTSGLCGTHRVHGGCGVLTTHTSHVCAQRLPGVGADRERWAFQPRLITAVVTPAPHAEGSTYRSAPARLWRIATCVRACLV